jgi:hypothetical protein
MRVPSKIREKKIDDLVPPFFRTISMSPEHHAIPSISQGEIEKKKQPERCFLAAECT